MMTNGFVHIDRETILNLPIWNKPCYYFKVFIYLLINANYIDDGNLKRGQVVADLEELASLCSSGTGKAVERHSKENIYRAISYFCSKTSGKKNEFKTSSKNKLLVTLSEYDKITNSKLLGNQNETETKTEGNKSTIIYNNNNNKNNKQVESRAAKTFKAKPTAFSNFKGRERDYDSIKQKAKEKLRRMRDEQQN